MNLIPFFFVLLSPSLASHVVYTGTECWLKSIPGILNVFKNRDKKFPGVKKFSSYAGHTRSKKEILITTFLCGSIPIPGKYPCHIVLKISGYVRCDNGDDH